MTITVTDLPDRVAEKIELVGDHWMWSGWTNESDYPYCRHEGRDQPAYRVVWFILVGQIPSETPELDHLCTIPRRVRPAHLEPVTHAENQRRIQERQVACRRSGHNWTDPSNVRVRLNGRRWCAECDRQDQRSRYAANRALGLTSRGTPRKRGTAA